MAVIQLMDNVAPEWAELAEQIAAKYREAKPFPHIVVDEAFPAGVLEEVLNEWPTDATAEWKIYDNKNERKKVADDVRHLGPSIQGFLNELNSQVFVDFLEQLTGIKGLVPDPTFLEAGAFDIKEGGFLNLHADFMKHRRTGLNRRINVLVYLNHDWEEENGGQLELWQNKPLESKERIVPKFNRMVIFNTLPDALHGHPQPVVNPPGGSRKCLSAYYFTQDRPIRESLSGWQGVVFEGTPKPSMRSKLRALLGLSTPPIVLAGARSLKNRLRGS